MIRRLAVEAKHLQLVLATDEAGGIGYQGDLPWPDIPSDKEHLRRVTRDVKEAGKLNAVIMGRVTWETIECRTWTNCLSVVISSRPKPSYPPSVDRHVVWCSSVSESLEVLGQRDDLESYVVLGGAGIYLESLKLGAATVWLTRVSATFPADTFVPVDFLETFHFVPDPLSPAQSYTENGISYSIGRYIKNPDI